MWGSIKGTSPSPWRGISFILTVALLSLASGCLDFDQNNNVKTIVTFGTNGTDDGQFLYLENFAFDANSNLLVTDALRADVQVITKDGSDRSQLFAMAKQTKAALQVDKLGVVADRVYFASREILACHKAGITVTLPKPQTSGNKAKGLFVKPDFRYMAYDDVYLCPGDERLVYHYTNLERGLFERISQG